jgi:D-proline reductase (dithiol) PrdB
MCNQAVSLIAAELERHGIATVAVQLLREIAERVGPPRALFVPFPHGYPLAEPDAPERQHAVLEAALRLLEDPVLEPPALVEFFEEGA